MSRYSGTDVDSPGWTGTITADSRRDTVYAFFDSRKDTTDMAAFMKTAADTPLSLYRVPGRGEEQGTLYVNQDEYATLVHQSLDVLAKRLPESQPRGLIAEAASRDTGVMATTQWLSQFGVTAAAVGEERINDLVPEPEQDGDGSTTETFLRARDLEYSRERDTLRNP